MTPMKYTDIVIIGGGLAGSTAAAMLGRAGISAVLIDPHPVYPPDFRVEKLNGAEQVNRFARNRASPIRSCDRPPIAAKTGSRAQAISSTKRPSRQFGLMYDQFVNIIRALPAWLATDGMDIGKIAAFYDDRARHFASGTRSLQGAPGDADPGERTGRHDQQRRRAPGDQQHEPNQRDPEIRRRLDRSRPHRIVKRCAQ
jgi:choline dehydrogenase-like flavoprotein